MSKHKNKAVTIMNRHRNKRERNARPEGAKATTWKSATERKSDD